MATDWIYLIIVFQQMLASGTFLAGKWALMDFPPLTLAFIRFSIAAMGLYGIHRVWPNRRPIEKADRGRFALLGVLAVLINQGFFLYGLKFTTPTHAALLYGTTPVFVYLIAVGIAQERGSWLKLVGVLITFGGVVVVVTREGTLGFGGKTWLGDLLILLAVIAWAFYTVLGKPMVRKYGAVHATAMAMITGTILYIPIGLMTLPGFDIGATTTRGWLSLFYIAIGTSVVAYTIWFWALGKLEATKVAVFNNLQPVMTALLSFWLMDERLGVQLIAGGALVILGVILTERG